MKESHNTYVNFGLHAPCKDCANRCASCHANCADYAKYKVELEVRRKAFRSSYADEYLDMMYTRTNRKLRKGRRRYE